MAIYQVSGKQFVDQMQPGVVRLVTEMFEKEIEEQLNTIIEAAIEKLQKEMPDKIIAKIEAAHNAFMHSDNVRVQVNVDWRRDETNR